MVECNLAKVDVEGSNPFSRSETKTKPLSLAEGLFRFGDSNPRKKQLVELDSTERSSVPGRSFRGEDERGARAFA